MWTFRVIKSGNIVKKVVCQVNSPARGEPFCRAPRSAGTVADGWRIFRRR